MESYHQITNFLESSSKSADLRLIGELDGPAVKRDRCTKDYALWEKVLDCIREFHNPGGK